MIKIPTLFKRDDNPPRHVNNTVNPEAQWVTNGAGIATRKYDGTACMYDRGQLYKRHTVKKGRTPPNEFRATSVIDLVTRKRVGWLPVSETDPGDQWHREALVNSTGLMSGYTYELVGPKVQGGIEGFEKHIFIRHGQVEMPNFPRDYEELKQVLDGLGVEGIVWHHPDGRMAKIKARDFGVKR